MSVCNPSFKARETRLTSKELDFSVQITCRYLRDLKTMLKTCRDRLEWMESHGGYEELEHQRLVDAISTIESTFLLLPKGHSLDSIIERLSAHVTP